jgi:hypothetical protein
MLEVSKIYIYIYILVFGKYNGAGLFCRQSWLTDTKAFLVWIAESFMYFGEFPSE